MLIKKCKTVKILNKKKYYQELQHLIRYYLKNYKISKEENYQSLRIIF